ncbi:MBL fold metallo-hydrolase [Carnobacteriaceae bacterium zg-ZUI252]|nr:MBL fold metallo-hydrolase [Carnobacteriaceae bacterium zg-ZUI252]MBS4770376.1 MBL fold metallo-hydrolase [Carnobacteriaceae bacterium zg-ZUI240]
MEKLNLQSMQFGDMTITWLRGVDKFTDAGTLFGPVPKVVWSKVMPTNENNMLVDYTDPLLIQYRGENYLVEASFDTHKLDEKQRRNLGIISESRIEESLALLGLTTDDIKYVLMTHMHHDHSGGLTKQLDDGQIVSKFKNATIYVQKTEWEEMQSPNKRTRGTYLQENWQPIVDQVQTFDKEFEVVPGIRLVHTGGHSNGHCIMLLQQKDETLIYMSDLLVSHAHFNPLWVPGLDDYPMQSIAAKEKWINEAYEKGYKFIFYHDQYYAMLQFDQTGKNVIDYLERNRKPIIPFTTEQTRRLNVND